MFETPINQKTVTLKLSRREVCDLRLACAAISQALKEDGTKWKSLHEKLDGILSEFDKKHDVHN